MPSRPTSPSRLRSRPSVAVTAYDARSDQVERLAEHAALLSEALDGIGEDIGWDLEVSLPVSGLEQCTYQRRSNVCVAALEAGLDNEICGRTAHRHWHIRLYIHTPRSRRSTRERQIQLCPACLEGWSEGA